MDDGWEIVGLVCGVWQVWGEAQVVEVVGVPVFDAQVPAPPPLVPGADQAAQDGVGGGFQRAGVLAFFLASAHGWTSKRVTVRGVMVTCTCPPLVTGPRVTRSSSMRLSSAQTPQWVRASRHALTWLSTS